MLRKEAGNQSANLAHLCLVMKPFPETMNIFGIAKLTQSNNRGSLHGIENISRLTA